MGTPHRRSRPVGTLEVTMTEAHRLAEQERLDRLKTPKERNRLGQFATPPALALDIARYAAESCRGRRVSFLDPAIGRRLLLLGPSPGLSRWRDRRCVRH